MLGKLIALLLVISLVVGVLDLAGFISLGIFVLAPLALTGALLVLTFVYAMIKANVGTRA